MPAAKKPTSSPRTVRRRRPGGGRPPSGRAATRTFGPVKISRHFQNEIREAAEFEGVSAAEIVRDGVKTHVRQSARRRESGGEPRPIGSRHTRLDTFGVEPPPDEEVGKPASGSLSNVVITETFHRLVVREAKFQGLTYADFVRISTRRRVKQAFRRRDSGGAPRPKVSRRGVLLADELDGVLA